MRKWLTLLVALVIALPAQAQDIFILEPNTLIEWDNSFDGTTFQIDDVKMRLELIYPADSRDWVEGAALTVSNAHQDFTLHTVAGLSGFGEIGYFQIDRAGGWSIVFGAYTGGAHCCMAVQTALLGPDVPVIADLGSYDGSTIAPRDLDDDGLYEFRLWDGRFNYSFDSYAGSFTPIVIMDTENGVLRDVTLQPQFYPLIKTEMQSQALRCGGPEGWYASACAALAANAARIGRYDSVRQMIATHLSRGSFDSGWDDFSFCSDEACTQMQEFSDFVEALDFSLENWGYL